MVARFRTFIASSLAVLSLVLVPEAQSATGPQTWNFTVAGSISIELPNFVSGQNGFGPTVVPVVVSPAGAFNASVAVPTLAVGPCTVQTNASIFGTFDSAIHVTLRLSLTSIAPSDPSCPNLPTGDT